MSNLLKLMIVALVLIATGCAVVQQDQVGVKRRFGKLDTKVKDPGLIFYNPITSSIVRVFIRTKNLSITENLPSKEGLTIRSESSILFSIRAQDVPKILSQTGMFYERDLILPLFRSAAADICSQYEAKDMHSSKRGEIELAIKERMHNILNDKGFIVEAVLLKSITLPSRIANSIERKQEEEQEAMRMQFTNKRQEEEAKRAIIEENANRERTVIRADARRQEAEINAEAEATATVRRAEAEAKAIQMRGEAMKKYNESVNSTLSANLLKLRQIEAWENLSTSSNAKIMMLDGKTPIMNMFGRD